MTADSSRHCLYWLASTNSLLLDQWQCADQCLSKGATTPQSQCDFFSGADSEQLLTTWKKSKLDRIHRGVHIKLGLPLQSIFHAVCQLSYSVDTRSPVRSVASNMHCTALNFSSMRYLTIVSCTCINLMIGFTMQDHTKFNQVDKEEFILKLVYLYNEGFLQCANFPTAWTLAILPIF